MKCDYVRAQGKKYYQAACQKGLEGIIGKKVDSPYVMGKRSPYWLKVKPTQELDCVICGHTKGEGWREKYFGALLLGCFLDNKLTYIGRVGSGLDLADLRMLAEAADYLETDCPFSKVPRLEVQIAVWFRPYLVCRVEYNEMTKDYRLRAPRYRGLRLDKRPEECDLPKR